METVDGIRFAAGTTAAADDVYNRQEFIDIFFGQVSTTAVPGCSASASRRLQALFI
jgi:hypothetical protein